MRRITLTDTIGELAEKNDPVYVYDTSGVYTDPSVKIDLRQGLSSVRSNWIEERDDTELLEGLRHLNVLARTCNIDFFRIR
jgi:phosphomethylpyrimidine synthase